VTFFTSSFAVAASHPQAVAVSRGLPRDYTGRVYEPLRPSWGLLGRTRKAAKVLGEAEARRLFNEEYGRKLAKLDANRVAADLGEGVVLLCWERDPTDPNTPCHRTLVAQWLARAGHQVSELPADHPTHQGSPPRAHGAEQLGLEFPE